MQEFPQPLFLIALFTIILYITLSIGRKFPTRTSQCVAFAKFLIAEYEDREWVCVDVIKSKHGGPLGSQSCQVLLESEKERILLFYYSEDIKQGTRIKLRTRKSSENAINWMSSIDQLMIPYVVK